MFTIKHPLGGSEPDAVHYSFAEVAAEIGCSEGQLRLRFENSVNREVPFVDPDTGVRGTRNIPVDALTGFRALHVADLARLVVERGIGRDVTAPQGFPGFVRYDEIEKASGLSGVKFAELLEEAKIREIKVTCLTAVGRKWALQNLGGLAVDTLPPEITGAAVAKYRDSLRHAVANAETEASAKGKPLTVKDRETVIAKAKAAAIRMATQPEAA